MNLKNKILDLVTQAQVLEMAIDEVVSIGYSFLKNSDESFLYDVRIYDGKLTIHVRKRFVPYYFYVNVEDFIYDEKFGFYFWIENDEFKKFEEMKKYKDPLQFIKLELERKYK